jgi:prevent-host-death family protein
LWERGKQGGYDAFYGFGGAALIHFLKDTKARFSEFMRRVRSERPQRVHGRDEVVVISAEEFRRLTGESLIAAMQASPHREVMIEPRRTPMPVREVAL